MICALGANDQAKIDEMLVKIQEMTRGNPDTIYTILNSIETGDHMQRAVAAMMLQRYEVLGLVLTPQYGEMIRTRLWRTIVGDDSRYSAVNALLAMRLFYEKTLDGQEAVEAGLTALQEAFIARIRIKQASIEGMDKEQIIDKSIKDPSFRGADLWATPSLRSEMPGLFAGWGRNNLMARAFPEE